MTYFSGCQIIPKFSFLATPFDQRAWWNNCPSSLVKGKLVLTNSPFLGLIQMDSSMRRLQLSTPQCRLGLQSCGRFANKRQEKVAQLDAFTSRIPDSKFLFQVCVSIPIILLFQSYQQPDVSGCSCRRRTAFRRVDLLHSLCQVYYCIPFALRLTYCIPFARGSEKCCASEDTTSVVAN